MSVDLLDLPHRGERLRDLAEMEGISLSSLASELGIPSAKVQRLARGESPLPDDVVGVAMDRYGLPVTFFSAYPVSQDGAAVTFRKLSRSSARSDKRVVRLFREAARMWRTASERSGLPAATVPTAEDRSDATAADMAQLVREADGLDDEAPVPNVIRLAERFGVGVVLDLDPLLAPEPGDTGGHDHSGASCPSRFEGRPLVVTVSPQPGAVTRMTVAHELGHLVFDADLPASPRPSDASEKRAFAFASALLLPESMMRRRVSETTTLNSYLRIKADYGVSAGAIVVRAHKMGLISSKRARSLHIQIASRGWRSNEPVPVPVEKPMLVSQGRWRPWPVTPGLAAATETGVKADLITSWTDEQSSPTPTREHDNVISLTERRALSNKG